MLKKALSTPARGLLEQRYLGDLGLREVESLRRTGMTPDTALEIQRKQTQAGYHRLFIVSEQPWANSMQEEVR